MRSSPRHGVGRVRAQRIEREERDLIRLLARKRVGRIADAAADHAHRHLLARIVHVDHVDAARIERRRIDGKLRGAGVELRARDDRRGRRKAVERIEPQLHRRGSRERGSESRRDRRRGSSRWGTARAASGCRRRLRRRSARAPEWQRRLRAPAAAGRHKRSTRPGSSGTEAEAGRSTRHPPDTRTQAVAPAPSRSCSRGSRSSTRRAPASARNTASARRGTSSAAHRDPPDRRSHSDSRSPRGTRAEVPAAPRDLSRSTPCSVDCCPAAATAG